METKRNIKVVYVDNHITKVVRGLLISEDLHTITLEAHPGNSILTVGKSALVKIERGWN